MNTDRTSTSSIAATIHPNELPFRSYLMQITESDFTLESTHVFYWLCDKIPENDVTTQPTSCNISVLYVYSSPCGLIRMEFPSPELASEVFALMTRYHVSPYHIEDILEDRDIPAVIRYL